MRYLKQLVVALVLLLTLCACSTTPQVPQVRLGECPRPPASLLQRMGPLPPIPTSPAGSSMPANSTTPAVRGSTG